MTNDREMARTWWIFGLSECFWYSGTVAPTFLWQLSLLSVAFFLLLRLWVSVKVRVWRNETFKYSPPLDLGRPSRPAWINISRQILPIREANPDHSIKVTQTVQSGLSRELIWAVRARGSGPELFDRLNTWIAHVELVSTCPPCSAWRFIIPLIGRTRGLHFFYDLTIVFKFFFQTYPHFIYNLTMVSENCFKKIQNAYFLKKLNVINIKIHVLLLLEKKIKVHHSEANS